MPKRSQLSANIDQDHLAPIDIARLVGKTRQCVYEWVQAGCPANDDGTLSMPKVVEWIANRATATVDDLAEAQARADLEKTQLQIKKLIQEEESIRTRIQKLNDQYVDRSYFESVLAARATGLRQFLEGSAIANTHLYIGLGLEEARALRLQEVRAMMEAYVNGGGRGGAE